MKTIRIAYWGDEGFYSSFSKAAIGCAEVRKFTHAYSYYKQEEKNEFNADALIIMWQGLSGGIPLKNLQVLRFYDVRRPIVICSFLPLERLSKEKSFIRDESHLFLRLPFFLNEFFDSIMSVTPCQSTLYLKKWLEESSFIAMQLHEIKKAKRKYSDQEELIAASLQRFGY